MMRSIFIVLLLPTLAWAQKHDCRLDLTKNLFTGDGAITQEWLQTMAAQPVSASQTRINDAVQTSGYNSVALNRQILENHTSDYSNELPVGCITSQESSGRCWIFAGNNMLRAELFGQKKTDRDFTISNTYLHFHNMLEKANRQIYLMESSQLKDMSRKDELEYIRKNFGDGGWYSWYQFLVAKYGLVPGTAMPETASSLNTAKLNQDLEALTNRAGIQIKAWSQEWQSKEEGVYTADQKAQLLKLRSETMAKIYRVLVTHLGQPPASFEYRTLDLKASRAANKERPADAPPVTVTKFVTRTYTPAQFRDEFVQYHPEDYVVILNSTLKPYNRHYEMVDSEIAVSSGHDRVYAGERVLNLPYSRMDELIRASIDSGRAVWFATDVNKFLDARKIDQAHPYSGIWHPDIYDPASVYGLSKEDFELSRAELAAFRFSEANHAMTITAYDKPNPTQPTIKLKVENSWDKNFGEGGYGHLYSKSAELFIAEIVVHRSLLNPRERQLLRSAPEPVTEDDIY